MINALRAESRRLLSSSRSPLMSLLGLLVLIAAYQLQVSSQVAPPSAAEVASVQRDYDEYVQDWEANHEEWEAECRDVRRQRRGVCAAATRACRSGAWLRSRSRMR